MEITDAFLICFFVLLFGACIGSFLNVAALRAISGESIVFPSSKCPECGTPIKWYDNIPVFSYLFTFKGKCRSCGCRVSIQYPIVEALTAVIFLLTYISFGFTVKTLLLLILFSVSIVIMITDIKKEYVFTVHSWILIIAAIGASLYFNGIENYTKPLFGLIAGVFAMEAAARLSYYLIRKRNVKTAETDETAPVQEKEKSADIDDENFDIDEYINEKKRAFGEGDTYLAAASGALLGWKYLLAALFAAVIIQALCVLPGFITNLYKNKHYELLISLAGFFALAGGYFILSKFMQLNLYTVLIFAAFLIFFAANTINRLKETAASNGFYTIPFGPAILISAFIMFFKGAEIISFMLSLLSI